MNLNRIAPIFVNLHIRWLNAYCLCIRSLLSCISSGSCETVTAVSRGHRKALNLWSTPVLVRGCNLVLATMHCQRRQIYLILVLTMLVTEGIWFNSHFLLQIFFSVIELNITVYDLCWETKSAKYRVYKCVVAGIRHICCVRLSIPPCRSGYAIATNWSARQCGQGWATVSYFTCKSDEECHAPLRTMNPWAHAVLFGTCFESEFNRTFYVAVIK